MFLYHCIQSLGHATDYYLFPDCQSFPLGNNFSPSFSKFPSTSVHIQLLYLDLAARQFSLQTIIYVTQATVNGFI